MSEWLSAPVPGLVPDFGQMELGRYAGIPEHPRHTGRANDDRLITLNLGLGRDSVTMIVLASKGKLNVPGVGPIGLEDLDYIVFADTGREWPESYDVIPRVERLVAGRVPVYVLRKPEALDPLPDWAEEYVRKHGRAPARLDTWRVHSEEELRQKAAAGGHHYRLDILADYASRDTVVGFGGDCTANHKIGAMRRLMNDVSLLRFGVDNTTWSNLVKKGRRRPHLALIGLAADETPRLERARAAEVAGKGVHYAREVYPLAHMRITKRGEDTILNMARFGDVRKSGCYLCKFQGPGWFWALSQTYPEKFAEVVEYEKRSLRRNKNMNVSGQRVSKKDVEVGGLPGPVNRPMLLPELVALWRSRHPKATVKAVLDKAYSMDVKEAKACQRREMGSDASDVELVTLRRGQGTPELWAWVDALQKNPSAAVERLFQREVNALVTEARNLGVA